MVKVQVIIPVIREEKANRCCDMVFENSGLPIYEIETIQLVDHERIGCPLMVKKLVERTSADLVCFLGDDSLPGKDFMKAAIAEMETFDGGWGLVGFNDNTGRMLPTHWLAHKKLLPFVGGEFFHTGYRHCFCDNELMARAGAIGRYKWCKDAVVDHDHPLVTGGEMDDDLKRVYADEAYQHDRMLFARRRANNWRTPAMGEVRLGIGLPLAGRMCDNQFWLSFLCMEKPESYALIWPSIEVYEFKRDIASIRNDLVEQAVDAGCTHLVMMDTDQVYPPDCLTKLMAHDVRIAAAPVHRRYPPFELILYRGKAGEMAHVGDEAAYSGDLIEVDMVGTGCVLLDMDVFARVGRPWFALTEENGVTIGEDAGFFREVRAAGETIWVDTSIEITHLGVVHVNRTVRELFKLMERRVGKTKANGSALDQSNEKEVDQ